MTGHVQLRRLTHGLASQGLASISNFALVVMVARSSTPEGFGAFAIAYSITLLLVGVMRGVVGETLAVTLSDRTTTRSETAAALGTAGVLGVLAGTVIGAVGVITPHELLGRWLVLFALGLPILVVQDAGRFVGFATHRPRLAVLSDGTWLGVQFAGWAVLAATATVTGETLLVVWWLAAGAGLGAIVHATGLPKPGMDWLRSNRRLASSFGVEQLLQAGASQGTVYAVGIVVGLPAAGALRAAQSLIAPLRSIVTGVSTVTLPEATRRRTLHGWGAMRRYTVRTTMTLSLVGLVGVAAFWSLPNSLGTSLLGDVWPHASMVIAPVGLSLLFHISQMGARIGLRATRSSEASLRLRSITGTLAFGLGVGGAVWRGLVAAAWGLALAHLIGAVLGWLFLARARQKAVTATNYSSPAGLRGRLE